MEIFLTDLADRDVLRIYTWLSEFSEERADYFLQQLYKGLAEIPPFPELGKRVKGLPFRRKLVPNFTHFGIYYRIHGNRIAVTAILDGRQDPDAIFRRLTS